MVNSGRFPARISWPILIGLGLSLSLTVVICGPVVGTGTGITGIDSDEDDSVVQERASLAKKSFARSSLAFASKAYYVLRDLNHQNLAFSPTILSTNLAMLRRGTNGTSATELQNTLSMSDLPDEMITEGISEYLSDFPDSDPDTDDIQFETAQRLYIPSTFKILDSFQESMLEDYSELPDPIKSVNFAQSVTTSGRINNWFRRNTRGKVQGIVNPEFFSGATKLVCISGLSFYGKWDRRFKYERPELFYVSKTHYTNSLMMNQLGRFDFIDLPKLNGSAVAIPYAGERLSLIVLVPYDLDGLPYMEEQLKGTELISIVDGMGKRNVDVYLPKFKIESTVVLNTNRAHIRKLGLDSIVSTKDEPDFSKLTAKKGLHLDQVIQKVVFEIDEEGVRNPPKLKKLKNENEPVIFRADHPFIIFVFDRETKTILLMGKKKQ